MTMARLLENPSKQTAYMREWRAKNSEHSKSYMRQYNLNRRKLVIEHYGGKCTCCDEDTFEFLAVDHINGGGTKHRAEVGGGSHMINWIIKQGFPEDYQILCHNCNQAIGFRGYCPHKDK